MTPWSFPERSVSIHAPARGATKCWPWARTWTSSFQSTPPHGGRLGPIPYLADARTSFQSTPPHGGRRAVRAIARDLGIVSIHAPARGATRICRRASTRPISFNPRPRTGGDWSMSCSFRIMLCFNPRPRTGGDPGDRVQRDQRTCFNPRPRTGGDRSHPGSSRLPPVSIHAPARGATMRRNRISPLIRFQSTPPHGGRLGSQLPPRAKNRFNPRPRTGGDFARWDGRAGHPCFNPRPRTGGDPCRAAGRRCWAVSIHAPARGATVYL